MNRLISIVIISMMAQIGCAGICQDSKRQFTDDNMIDAYAIARDDMVCQRQTQLSITDSHVLNAMQRAARHEFVPMTGKLSKEKNNQIIAKHQIGIAVNSVVMKINLMMETKHDSSKFITCR
jgi:hypothetical protein